MSEQTYTLAEAQEQLKRQECERHGHDFDVFVAMGSADPTVIVCTRCGKSWTVAA